MKDVLKKQQELLQKISEYNLKENWFVLESRIIFDWNNYVWYYKLWIWDYKFKIQNEETIYEILAFWFNKIDDIKFDTLNIRNRDEKGNHWVTIWTALLSNFTFLYNFNKWKK